MVQMRLCRLGEVVCDYGQYGWLPALLAEHGASVLDSEFTDRVTVRFSLPCGQEEGLQAALTDRSAGQLQAQYTGEEFVPCPMK